MRSPLVHLLIAIAVMLGTIVAYGTWYSVVSNESAVVASIQDQITTASENMKRIAAARAALAEIAGDEAKVRSYFVSEDSVVSFIDSLQSTGKNLKADVAVQSVAKGGTPAQPTLAFVLSVSGTFDAVMRTIGAIEYAPYDVIVTSLSVSEDDKHVWHSTVNLTVGSAPPKRATTTP